MKSLFLIALIWFAAGFMVGIAIYCPLAHAEESHETEARAACRNILSPAMATAHPEYEKRLYWRCVELQRKVPWRLTDSAIDGAGH